MGKALGEMTGQHLMLAFWGQDTPSPEFLETFQKFRPGGITLFRSFNVDNPPQVRRLTSRLQSMAEQAGIPPLLIAVDQEGGQLMTIEKGATLIPGNMALGAAGSVGLSRQAGEVLGRELAAMGINVNYAPCCDVNSNPQNPVIGIRSFGEDPSKVAELAAAMVSGIQSAGVAACAKHFPGHGDTAGDSHAGLPVVPYSLDRLQKVEFPPFESAIAAGTKLVMTAHLALPAIDGAEAPPATLSPAILGGLLRGRLRFGGVIISDALDMQAIGQGTALGENAVRALASGVDLLLTMDDPDDQRVVHASLQRAVENGTLSEKLLAASLERISALKKWLAERGPVPGLEVVGCAEHRRVADEIAARSVTLVRDRAKILPLRLRPDQRVAAVVPRPVDLTPADTSSYVLPALASALRTYHPRVDEILVAHTPSAEEIASIAERTRGYDLVVIGTLNAYTNSGQAALVHKVLAGGAPVVVAALRLPYDLAAFPEAPTYICTYSILEPSLKALASALFGKISFQGRLPVSIPGFHPVGFHLGR